MARISRTLLAHEWLAEIGGSENVLEQMQIALPAAAIACLWNDAPGRFPRAQQTWLARTPLRHSKAAALPFMTSGWKRLDLAGIDRVVASSHAFSHHLASRAAADGLSAFAYVHSPARYLWASELDRRAESPARRRVAAMLRRKDRKHASADVRYAANSGFVAERIRRSWGIDAEVIYPPVRVREIAASAGSPSDAERDVLGRLPSGFVLGASRFVQYKRLEAAIQAGEILDLPVVLAGSGPDERRLRALAADSKVPVSFLGKVSDAALFELYRRAQLYVFMAVEDFGIMPVEALAAGGRVLVSNIGGTSEIAEISRSGVATSWEDSGFRCPDDVKIAAEQDVSTGSARVEMFDSATFRGNFLRWIGDE